MNVDRATLNFLNAFPSPTQKEGERLQKEGCVTQIFGDHLFIRGRVEDSNVCNTLIKLKGDRWIGSCSCEDKHQCPALYATMLERCSRGENLPESPNEIGEDSLLHILEEKLERELSEKEAAYIIRLEKRYRRYVLEKKIYDYDLVRLHPKWEIKTYDPLVIWPHPPQNIVEFWNYIAHEFRQHQLAYPEFMEAITDSQWTAEQVSQWKKRREIAVWKKSIDRIHKFSSKKPVEKRTCRLLVTMNKAKLQLAAEGEDYRIINRGELEKTVLLYKQGGMLMDTASHLLFFKFFTFLKSTQRECLHLEKRKDGRLINALFQDKRVRDLLITLDESPFFFQEAPLQWVCQELAGGDGYGLQLFYSPEERVLHSLRILPGREMLYLSDDTVFLGPIFWEKGTEVMPHYSIPKSIVESESGIAFLHRIGCQLPDSLEARVEDSVLHVTLNLELLEKQSEGEHEYLLAHIEARDTEGYRVEVFREESWKIRTQKEKENGFFRFDRKEQHLIPHLLHKLKFFYDEQKECYKARLTKNFPRLFTEWMKQIPKEITVETDERLSTILKDPITATLDFEVKEKKKIDWFDLRLLVQVDGYDLNSEQIHSLLNARGDFVRMEDGAWLRLKLDLSKEKAEAIRELGLDPYDFSGDVHPMHVLHLAKIKGAVFFNQDTWNTICDRATSLQLQVAPTLSQEVKAVFRPYQMEGFHFLAYLAANRFGGILADDMGLGKTLQSLAWLLWLKSNEKKKSIFLVVCPKSVLDVWGAEAKKFIDSFHVDILRDTADLDLKRLHEIDLLVINYAQMRGCIEKLKKVNWKAVILDEGQQIKNPHSKVSKASRLLKAEHRLVLTGTPIENRLLDVWSLMAFAMPGVLGDRRWFKKKFDKGKDPTSQLRLAARLRPFLLRRTKNQVAMELPARAEEEVLCRLEGIQQTLYEEELARIKELLLGLKTDADFRKQSFVVLQGLTRLRQICCHPGLIDSQYVNEPSAKMVALFYLLDQLQEGGHKVLVFSQFVTMLNLIKEELEKQQRPYFYLTGKTKNRKEVVDSFQYSKEAAVFLLSLKAGGSGLNLTAASYVVLYDPWWNPAVENQAIDRTHRIGQKNRVMAYRLLTRDSVEEKIRMLQRQKDSMISGVLGNEGFAQNLKKEDVEFLFSPDEEKEPITKM